MNNKVNLALDYMLPPEGYFWNWDETGEFSLWSDEHTLAHRSEIELVVQHLAPYGLPNLGSLLIVVAATRKSWDGAAARRCFEKNLNLIPVFDHYETVLDNVFANLDQINQQIPDSLRTPQLSSSLGELIFRNNSAALGLYECREITGGLKLGISSVELSEGEPTLTRQEEILKDLETLEYCLNEFNSSNIFNSINTGLSAAPEKITIKNGENSKAATLQEILADNKLKGLGQLVQRLLAVMDIPRAMADEDPLPLGGVSDITNRGELDKLLLSELANDDLTLAVRVANNEALYIRREAPPGKPPVNKTVFLDQGIRYWGKSRLYALAVAVSLNLKSDDQSVKFVSHLNRQFSDISLDSKEEILKLMEVLEITLSPTEALRRYFFSHDPADSECLFIFHEKQMKETQLQEFLNELNLSVYTLCLVNEHGLFRMIRCTNAERKTIVEAQLDFADLFEEEEWLNKDLPKFYSYNLAPLRLPLWDNITKMCKHEGKYYILTKSSQLLIAKPGAICADLINDFLPHQLTDLHIYDDTIYFVRVSSEEHALYCIKVTSLNKANKYVKVKTLFNAGDSYFSGTGFIQTGDGTTSCFSLETREEELISAESTSQHFAPKPDLHFRDCKLNHYGSKVHRFSKVLFIKGSYDIYLQSTGGTLFVLNRIHNFTNVIKEINSKRIFNCKAEFKVTDQILIKKAQFPCGSSVYLDKQGFLHLQSRDSNLAEVSFLLNTKNIAIWTSKGHYSGDKAAIPDEKLINTPKTCLAIEQFIDELFL